jgi:HEAT repeat protein
MSPRLIAATLALLLAACGGRDSDPVVRIRMEPDANLRRKAVQDLLEEGPDATRLWRGLLAETDPEIPRMTAAALGSRAGTAGWERPPDGLLDLLLGAAARKEPAVRAEAVLAAGRLYAADTRVPARLLPFLSDPAPAVRRSAAQAFRALGRSTAGIDLAPLRALLRAEGDVSLEAALALAACGDPSPEGVERLAAAAEDGKDPVDALRAVRALAELGPVGGAAAPRMAKALPGASPALSAALVDALGRSGSPDPAVQAALVRALGRREADLRTSAAEGLGRLAGAGRELAPGTRAALEAASKDPDPGVRAAAAAALTAGRPKR